jgi:hypothetical protein
MKNVHDVIDEIDQHPTPATKAFHVTGPHAAPFHLLDNVLCDGADVTVRCPGDEKEEVSRVGDAAQVKDEGVAAFPVADSLDRTLQILRRCASRHARFHARHEWTILLRAATDVIRSC